MAPRFLFRHPRRGGHVFITTEDPTYRYETLCGHCDFPIESSDDHCPRCQKALEDCPVCRHRTHRRSPIQRDASQPQVAFCPVCHVTRHPIGWTQLGDLDGSFCTNLYGCPAGGLVLRSDELAVLPRNASICPVCKDPQMVPLAIKGFQYLLRHCAFCSTLYGSGSNWSRGWSEEPISRLSSYWLRESSEVCSLCGRNDRLLVKSPNSASRMVSESVSEDAGLGSAIGEGISLPAYFRIVELARSLALNTDHDEAAFRKILHQWFDVSGHEPPEADGLSVRKLVDALVRGTLKPQARGSLQGRIEKFENAWERHLGVGLGYRVTLGHVEDDGSE